MILLKSMIIKKRPKNKSLLMTQLLLISFLISIKGYQCNSSASSENHVSTYKSVFKIIPPGAEENVENVTPTSSLPMSSKFTHPVILSPYR